MGCSASVACGKGGAKNVVAPLPSAPTDGSDIGNVSGAKLKVSPTLAKRANQGSGLWIVGRRDHRAPMSAFKGEGRELHGFEGIGQKQRCSCAVALEESVTAFLRDNAIPGASVAIFRGGRRNWVRSYGTADVFTQVPMLPQTSLPWGPATDCLTTAELAWMLARSDCSLDDCINDNKGESVDGNKTLLQSFDECSGVWHNRGVDFEGTAQWRQLEQYLDSRQRTPAAEDGNVSNNGSGHNNRVQRAIRFAKCSSVRDWKSVHGQERACVGCGVIFHKCNGVHPVSSLDDHGDPDSATPEMTTELERSCSQTSPGCWVHMKPHESERSESLRDGIDTPCRSFGGTACDLARLNAFAFGHCVRGKHTISGVAKGNSNSHNATTTSESCSNRTGSNARESLMGRLIKPILEKGHNVEHSNDDPLRRCGPWVLQRDVDIISDMDTTLDKERAHMTTSPSSLVACMQWTWGFVDVDIIDDAVCNDENDQTTSSAIAPPPPLVITVLFNGFVDSKSITKLRAELHGVLRNTCMAKQSNDGKGTIDRV